MEIKETKWIFPVGDPIQNFLEKNGLGDFEDCERYLNFSEEQLRTSYKDLDKVVDAIVQAIENDKHILVYGDYDCDGITATSIIILALRNIGVDANYFINDRFKEGYGMNSKGINRLLEQYPETNFIITCDNGIAAKEGIELALSKGIEVVCTDHHLQKDDIIVPTVDEWRLDESEELREQCCGAEIARRVMLALYKKLDMGTDYIHELIALSGISTVCDVVKFTAANRYIVKECLKLLNQPKQSIKVIQLIKEILELDEIDEDTLGFKIGPMMNAMSRVNGSPNEMVEILTTKTNSLEAYNMIIEAANINEERKALTEEDFNLAKDEINEEDACIVLAGEYHPGIAGLVASHVVENYNRPCICLCKNGDLLKGSARTYDSFHLKNALDQCQDLLVSYGGHAGAAGVALKEENLPAFKERMNKLVEESGVLEKVPEILIDYVCSASNLFDENITRFIELAPFGEGFEKPKIVYSGRLYGIRYLPMGDDPKHVAFDLVEGGEKVQTIWFNAAERFNRLSLCEGDDILVMGYPTISKWNDKYSRKLFVDDIKSAL